MPALTVIVLAAGQGTRMRSQTPKMLHPLCGRPLVGWPIAAAREAGARRIVVVDSPDGALAEHLPDGVASVVQPAPNGTGGAVQAAAAEIGDGRDRRRAPGRRAARHRPGDPRARRRARRQRRRRHDGHDGPRRPFRLRPRRPRRRTARSSASSRRRPTATPPPSSSTIREVNSSIFAFDGAALDDRARRADAPTTRSRSSTSPTSCRPCAPPAAPSPRTRSPTPTSPSASTTASSSREVRAIAQRRIHDAHGRAGVTIVDPASTLIDVTVTIGEDTTIEPSSYLRGATTIGEGCTVGPLTTLIDATLHDDVTIPHSYVVNAEIEDGATVGPFAYLRPGHAPAPALEGRHVRRDQELRRRRGQQGPAPLLHRRRRHRRGHEPRRRHDHRQLRRHQQAPHDDRRPRPHGRRHDARRARDARRRRVDRRELRDHQGRPGQGARHRPRAPDQLRGLRGPQAPHRRLTTRRPDRNADR